MRTDSEVNSHVLYSWTVQRLEHYAARVSECRDLPEALDFARYVLNSRLSAVLRPHSSPDSCLKVDPDFLDWKARELARAVQDRYALNDTSPHLEALQLQSLHEKLNTIAGYLSKLAGQPGGPAKLELNVISGGLDVEGAGAVEQNATAG
jgi:hypothetical protein